MKNLINQWKWTFLFGVLIICLAFFLRYFNLNQLPVFADEAIYIRWAQVMKAESTLRFLPLSDGKQPLFMWTVIPFLKLVSDPLVAGRLVSVFSGIGTLVGIFTASYLLFNSKKASLISSLLYALSPYSIFFDRLSLVDSMLSMFGIWTFVGGVLLAKNKRLDIALLTGFILGFALLTKSTALLFVLMFPAVFILSDFSKSQKISNLIKTLFLILTTFAVGYGMCNILRLGPNFHLLKSRSLDYVYPYTHILTSFWDPLKPFADRILEYYQMIGPIGLVFLAVLGIYSIKKYPREILVLLVWGLIPVFIVSEFSKTMTARYALFTLPYFILIAGSVFADHKSRIINSLGYISLLVFLVQGIYIDKLLLTNIEKAPLPRSERSGYLEEWTAGHGIKEVSNYLKSEFSKSPNKKIVVGTEGYFGTLPDGLQMYMADRPEVTVVGIGLELDKVPAPLANSVKAKDETYLVVNDSRMIVDYRKLKMTLIASYPKATKPDGGLESLYLLKVN